MIIVKFSKIFSFSDKIFLENILAIYYNGAQEEFFVFKKNLKFVFYIASLFTVFWTSFLLFLIFYNPSPALPKKTAETIVILGAGFHRDGVPVPALAARLDTGVLLWKQTDKKASLLVSGRMEEVLVMTQYLGNAGVPAKYIVADTNGTNTAATVYRFHNINDGSKLIFVSQAYHLPRLRFYAYIYGIKGATFAVAKRIPLTFWEMLPIAFRESLAILSYPFTSFRSS